MVSSPLMRLGILCDLLLVYCHLRHLVSCLSFLLRIIDHCRITNLPLYDHWDQRQWYPVSVYLPSLSGGLDACVSLKTHVPLHYRTCVKLESSRASKRSCSSILKRPFLIRTADTVTCISTISPTLNQAGFVFIKLVSCIISPCKFRVSVHHCFKPVSIRCTTYSRYWNVSFQKASWTPSIPAWHFAHWRSTYQQDTLLLVVMIPTAH